MNAVLPETRFTGIAGSARRVRAVLGAAQKIDQPVACDRIQPRRQRVVRIVAFAARVERHQRLLHQILRILVAAAQPRAEKGAQQRRRFRQKRAMRGFIAGETS